jgi:hypothetical protein
MDDFHVCFCLSQQTPTNLDVNTTPATTGLTPANRCSALITAAAGAVAAVCFFPPLARFFGGGLFDAGFFGDCIFGGGLFGEGRGAIAFVSLFTTLRGRCRIIVRWSMVSESPSLA